MLKVLSSYCHLLNFTGLCTPDMFHKHNLLRSQPIVILQQYAHHSGIEVNFSRFMKNFNQKQ